MESKKQSSLEKNSAGSCDEWNEVRSSFLLSQDYIQMAGFVLTSHPKPVRDAIEYHRLALDQNPALHIDRNWNLSSRSLNEDAEEKVFRSAGNYLETDHELIALTGSTTEGLAMLYGGISMRPDQEFLTSEHEHISAYDSIQLRCNRSGVKCRKIRLYEAPFAYENEQAISRILSNIRPETRVLALTWVHSISGVKIDISKIAESLKPINAEREPDDRILLCVDGVHGLGVEDFSPDSLGCDFFVAGTHKWLFGPRGTGIVWGKRDAWNEVAPLIPSFSRFLSHTPGRVHTAGGFHAFEHRWALHAAFEFHANIGKEKIQNRIHALATRVKAGIEEISGLQLVTPISNKNSSGFVCFNSAKLESPKFVNALLENKVIATTSPDWESPDIRISPSLFNTEKEIDKLLDIILSIQSKSA